MKRHDINRLRGFYEENRQRLFVFTLSITKNRESAEDILHTVILRMLELRRLPQYLHVYIFRSCRNAAIDDWRRKKTRRDSMFEIPGSETSDFRIESKIMVEDLLEELSPNFREVIVMKDIVGLTFEEIASILHRPRSTIASQHRRGIEKLQQSLEDSEQ